MKKSQVAHGVTWIVSASSAAGRFAAPFRFRARAKNATLPLMIASLLTKDTLILDNVPRLADVYQWVPT